MGSVVKSIGKAIKKVTSGIGKLIKKIGPVLLLAAGLFMGTAAFGSTLGAAAGGNMFSWGNFTQGASAIGSSIFGGGAGAGAAALSPTQSALAGSGARFTGSVATGAQAKAVTGLAGTVAGTGLSGNVASLNTATQGSGIFNFIKSAIKDSPATSLMAFSQLIGTGLEVAGALFDTSEADALAEEKRQFDISHTYAGFAPGTTQVSDLPSDAPYFQRGPTMPSIPTMDSFQMAAKASREPGFGRQPSDTTFGRAPSVAGSRGPSILGESGMGMISGNDPRRYT
jgi:hypothetical protein